MLLLPPLDPGIEIVAASEGISKGVAQTDGGQLVVRGELAFGSGYFSGLAKNLASTVAEGEVQLALGARQKFGAFDVVGFAAYKKWIDPRGNPDSQAAEFGITVSRTSAKVTPRFQLIYSPDDLGSTGRSLYAEAGVSWKVNRWLQLGANLGRRKRTNGPDYTSGNIGAAAIINRNLTADLRFYGTNRGDVAEPFKERVVASVRAKF